MGLLQFEVLTCDVDGHFVLSAGGCEVGEFRSDGGFVLGDELAKGGLAEVEGCVVLVVG